MEPQFFAELVEKAGLPRADIASQYDASRWADRHQTYAEVFRSRSRDDWARIFEGSDACVAPVLDFSEVEAHPHNKARSTFVKRGGVLQASPAPRFSRTPAGEIRVAPAPGTATDAVLKECGMSEAMIAEFRAAGVLT